jgi:hypothetical protein
MESPIRVSIPRNEITILIVALIIAIIYNTQTGIGMWSTISLVTIIIVLVLGSVFLIRLQTMKPMTMTLLVVFLFTVTGFMIAYNFIFYNSLRPELKDGYWTPVLITNVFHGIILLISLVAIILISANFIQMTPGYMRIYENLFSIAITLVLLNSGLMAGA